MRQAKIFIVEKKVPEAHNSIMRAQAIIEELNLTLNMDIPVSLNLRQLYVFILEQLIEANASKDAQYIDTIYPMVEELRDTWKEAMRRAKIERKTGKKYSEVDANTVDEIFK